RRIPNPRQSPRRRTSPPARIVGGTGPRVRARTRRLYPPVYEPVPRDEPGGLGDLRGHDSQRAEDTVMIVWWALVLTLVNSSLFGATVTYSLRARRHVRDAEVFYTPVPPLVSECRRIHLPVQVPFR